MHHTAAEYASLAGIDRYHRNRFGSPLGAEYHFVVNNGRKAPMGWVQAARWRYDTLGAHLFHPERAPNCLALCLIGNFETRPVPGVMLRELAALTRTLMDKFAIPIDRVSTHRGVDGRLTQCPGRYFPTARFLRRLEKLAGEGATRAAEVRHSPGTRPHAAQEPGHVRTQAAGPGQVVDVHRRP